MAGLVPYLVPFDALRAFAGSRDPNACMKIEGLFKRELADEPGAAGALRRLCMGEPPSGDGAPYVWALEILCAHFGQKLPNASVATIDDEKRELSHHPERLPMLPGELRPHPTPRQYILIAVVLVIITGFEIATSYISTNDVSARLIAAVLITMAAVKFSLVVAWYMHLRTDLKIFRRMFVGGLLLAGAVYLVMLSMLHVFDQGKHAR